MIYIHDEMITTMFNEHPSSHTDTQLEEKKNFFSLR